MLRSAKKYQRRDAYAGILQGLLPQYILKEMRNWCKLRIWGCAGGLFGVLEPDPATLLWSFYAEKLRTRETVECGLNGFNPALAALSIPATKNQHEA